MRVITNNVPRDVIDDHQLSSRERAQFDYLDWDAIDHGEDSASFVRYRGELIDLGEFMPGGPPGWHGVRADSFFSGVVIRLLDCGDRVIVGTVLS